MYRIKIVDHFSSAHQLKGYRGKCEELHGHNWKVEVGVAGKTLDNVGLLMDFNELKRLLREVLLRLDHRLLNELSAFKDTNPSSEALANYIYNELKPVLPSGVFLEFVSVWESDNSSASYSEL